MRFASYWADETAQPSAPVESLPPPPDGTHQATIKFVDVRGGGRQKTEQNPDGDYLLMLVEIPRYSPVWARIPLHFRGKIEAVFRAASLLLPSPNETADEVCKRLKNRVVTVDTLQGIGHDGREYVRIEQWKAGAKPLPADVAEAPPSRPAASKPMPAGADDIPF